MRSLLVLLAALAAGAGCGPPPAPAPPKPPPASRPARAPASAPAAASLPASQPAIAVWPRERCAGLGPMPTGAARPAARLEDAERAALGRAGAVLAVARTPMVAAWRGGRLELHPRTGNGKHRDGEAPAPPPRAVVCDRLGEADLVPEPGCDQLFLCRGDEAYALVVVAGGRPVAAAGEPLALAEGRARLVQAPEAGEAIVWRATERGRAPGHELTREVVLRPHRGRLRQVFGAVTATTVADDEPEPASQPAPASRPASAPAPETACRVATAQITCGTTRYAWDPARFAYRVVPGPGRLAYQTRARMTGLDAVHSAYAALHAAAALGLTFERRGTSCVEAQRRFEFFSTWPKAPVAHGEPGILRVAAEPGRVEVEVLPFGEDAPVDVPAGYPYARELGFLDALGQHLAPEPAGPPKGREGFRCAEGFGQPVADVSLGAKLDQVVRLEQRRERRYRTRCATAAAGAVTRLRCESRDRVTRIYDFSGGALVAVGERWASEVAERHMARAEERWGERFGEPARVTAPAPAGAELRWTYRGVVLTAARLADGAALFLHRRADANFSLEAPATGPVRK
jgi:hypothetical protein